MRFHVTEFDKVTLVSIPTPAQHDWYLSISVDAAAYDVIGTPDLEIPRSIKHHI